MIAQETNTSKEHPKALLCSEDFLCLASQLPTAAPPRWMKSGLIATGILMLICMTTVALSPMDEYVTAPGEVRPAEFTLVFSKSDGILESVEVTDRSHVSKNQLLARLDGWEKKKEIARIEGEVNQARAELNLARATIRKVTAAPVPPEFLFSAVEMERQKEIQGIQQAYLKRLEDLQKTGAASTTELLNVRLQIIASESLLKRSQQAHDLFTGDYGAASKEEANKRQNVIEARLKSLEKELTLAHEELNRLDVVTPKSGIILATARRFPGEKVLAGEALFKITETSGTELRLYATEDRVNLIQTGQLVRFRANNNADRLAPLAVGRVTEVALDRDLESKQNDKVPQAPYRITVAVEKVSYPLAVGATVEAEIVIARRPFWRLLFLKTTPRA